MNIACLSIPRFAIEAERRRHPDIAVRLILIGDGEVHACSLGAETSGVRVSMRMSEAIALCPKAVVIPPDNAHYDRRFEEVLSLLDEVSPDVEPSEPGLAYVSLSGLSGDPQIIAERLISSLHKRTGFMASTGIAGNKFTARVAAASSRPGIVKAVAVGDEAAFLAPFACTYLPASEAMLWRLKMLGIETIGDVAKLPIGAFQQQFGAEGKRCWELARGIDKEPLVPRMVESSVVRRLQMPAPSVSLEAIFAGLERLTFAAYNDESRQGRWVRRAVARAALDGGGTWESPVAFREALADPKAAWFVIKAAVTRHPPARPVEELEIELVGLSGESGNQATMFDGKANLQQEIEEAVRQLAARGDGPSLGRIVDVEPWSRIPERRRAVQDLA